MLLLIQNAKCKVQNAKSRRTKSATDKCIPLNELTRHDFIVPTFHPKTDTLFFFSSNKGITFQEEAEKGSPERGAGFLRSKKTEG